MKRISFPLSLALVFTALCAAQNQQTTGDHFRQEGIASWYGTEFDGRPTASGETFNSKELTAAHPTLPFGTTLLITNKHNMRQIVVRVNDRGPFVSARIIDLSMAAAEALDMLTTGTAPVLVEEIAATVSAVAAVPAVVVPAAPAAPVSPARSVPETAGVPTDSAPAGIPAAAPVPGTPAALPGPSSGGAYPQREPANTTGSR
jgi:rare lipoprotein A